MINESINLFNFKVISLRVCMALGFVHPTVSTTTDHHFSRLPLVDFGEIGLPLIGIHLLCEQLDINTFLNAGLTHFIIIDASYLYIISWI